MFRIALNSNPTVALQAVLQGKQMLGTASHSIEVNAAIANETSRLLSCAGLEVDDEE